MIYFLFHFFAVLIVLSSISVVYVSNPVYSVLFLILTFFISSTLFILLGAELIAMLVIIVYVGAVAVLFLFVVMMLDINYSRLKSGFTKYLAIGLLCGMILFVNIVFVIKQSATTELVTGSVSYVSNVIAIGNLIYTKYMYVFHLSGILLLISIIGSLVLTLRTKNGNVYRQSVGAQVNRSSTVKYVNVKVRQGVDYENSN
ncbi:NADH-ubiquinone/plastoquinone oxidoreductase chain 6 family protein [Ehrlichia chaffeensis str. Heartland]|uniref:NADH-quinone oxidoreductase subunit J n=1 Tax=Ehrlichia chaffeensis (strain ATCC CRL-10679 / Arkansas) TaxID=205920 RepID=Q2GGR9_EHRCR|nr:NADH-quinone oxidoreductase subunit J [Ehrlichia chaffeensis]ABD45020.1 NADH dehydrogenase I, J subunit [Ehrlichia chaffeensis str. Arkansas]AHX03643.1 NADH-ubiquinone/plastoquinone oxidoreductase chain 6 family protein [Ehrlichia chaffeensis str. Heartland]AHX05636.1 NADH-ubiquinone/plastoquinone oxidoreductase chain 6 family protein [Ehrlichia chaffeensis str. Jax]AHX06627.1 NADH-ubiquinone/plastoquinone oxidoreductase chain 6 family protein [Ehrlichia chaffeensis str. Liberty]AHX07477.1 